MKVLFVDFDIAIIWNLVFIFIVMLYLYLPPDPCDQTECTAMIQASSTS